MGYCEIKETDKFSCRICKNTDKNKQHTATEMRHGTKHTFPYIECSECGCLQIEQIPVNMYDYYGSIYYSYQPCTSLNERVKLSIRSFVIRQRWSNFSIFSKIFSFYQGYLFFDFLYKNGYLHTYSKVLDIGCGSGSLLLQLKHLGFQFLKGADPFIEKDLDYGNGVSIDKKYLHEINEKYDLIMLHHSFEHIDDPESSLKEINRILSIDGFAFIRIPMASSFAWRHYGVNWAQLDAPRHLYLHTIESMKILANRTGFDIVDIHFDSTEFQFWASEQYKKGIPLESEYSYHKGNKSMFTKQQLCDYRTRAKVLNEEGDGDQACFTLKKSICTES